MAKIADAAWICGDPGMQYDTTINHWHPVKTTHRINASNPCSEYMFVDDSACNLASLNLMKFFNAEDGSFDVDDVQARVRRRRSPRRRCSSTTARTRPSRSRRTATSSVRSASATRTSARCSWRLASVRLRRGPRLRGGDHVADVRRGVPAVVARSRPSAARSPATSPTRTRSSRSSACTATRRGRCPARAACRPSCSRRRSRCGTRRSSSGAKHGFQNGQVTVLAPTGTIGFMMDCDTTGVEPDIAIVKYKKLVGGGTLKIVNQTVPLALKRLGYDARHDPRDHRLRRREGHHRGRAGLQGGAPAGVRLRVPRAERHPLDPLHGPRPDDVGRAAVPLGRDLEDRQPAAGRDAGRDRGRLHGRLEAGPQGDRDLPRRVQAHAAAQHGRRRRATRSRRWRAGRSSTSARRRPRSAAPYRRKLPDERRSITHKFSSAATRATSRSASTRTASPARSSCACRRKAR